MLMWTKQPFLKGSVLEPLILMHILDGDMVESTAMSCTPKWTNGEKLAKLGG